MYDGSSTQTLIYQLIFLLNTALVGYFVYQDARERGMSAGLWGVLAFLLCPVVPIIYLFIRKPKSAGTHV